MGGIFYFCYNSGKFMTYDYRVVICACLEGASYVASTYSTSLYIDQNLSLGQGRNRYVFCPQVVNSVKYCRFHYKWF